MTGPGLGPRHRLVTLISFFVVLGATVCLFIIIPKGFVPDQDTDQLAGHHRSRSGHQLHADGGIPETVADIVNRRPRRRVACDHRWRSECLGSRRTQLSADRGAPEAPYRT